MRDAISQKRPLQQSAYPPQPILRHSPTQDLQTLGQRDALRPHSDLVFIAAIMVVGEALAKIAPWNQRCASANIAGDIPDISADANRVIGLPRGPNARVPKTTYLLDCRFLQRMFLCAKACEEKSIISQTIQSCEDSTGRLH